MLHRGTEAEFNIWHDPVKVARGLPNDGDKTTAYAKWIPHPENEDNGVWFYGEYEDAEKQIYTVVQMKAAGFFPDPIDDF